jgi:hypothetical protein
MPVARDLEPLAVVFEDDGLVPNNPMPFLVYQGAVAVGHDHPEQTIEDLFGANGWGGTWRNGVYDFLHYHGSRSARRRTRPCPRAVRWRSRPRIRDRGGRRRHPARRHRAPMPRRERRFLRDRRLSAGIANARHPPDPGEPREGVEDHSGSEAAGDRSGDGQGWSAAETVEAELACSANTIVILRSRALARRLEGWAPNTMFPSFEALRTAHLRRSARTSG